MKFRSAIRNRVAGLLEVLHFDNRLQLILSRGIFRPSMDVYYYRGLEILVDHAGGDVNGVRACLATRMYRQFLDAMGLSKQGITVLDLGANVGGFCLLLRAEGYTLCKVIALELNPFTCARLHLNLTRNLPDTDLHIVNEALYSTVTSVEMPFGRGSTGDSLSATYSSTAAQVRSVRTNTLDGLIEKYVRNDEIDVCKIDVEGAEWDVFGGAHFSRIRQCKNIIMEIHPHKSMAMQQMYDQVSKLGFSVAGQDASSTVVWFRRHDV